jgi:hypothetical protein
MGSVGLNSPRLAAFQNDVFPRGLDLGRCEVLKDLGVYRAADAADFEAGMLVSQDAAGDLIKAVSRPVLGVAKWNKTNVYTAAIVDEAVSFPVADATVSLRHPNVSNVRVQSAVELGGTTYTVTTDYTVNAVNGTVTHVNSGSIPVATTVYVTYTYDLSARDLDFQGRNFYNFTDDVSVADNRITVIQDADLLFTSMYDTNRSDYALSGTGRNLYCGGATPALAGLFTTDNGEGDFVGHVIQLPRADDPFLGVRLSRGLIVQP